MINLNRGLKKLLNDVKESSPNFKKSLEEISPLSFGINIEGHNKINIELNGDKSNISFNSNKENDFEIVGTTIDIIKVVTSGKIQKNLIKGDSELAIVFLNSIYKSNIDVIYLIDKYFGSLPAVFTYKVTNEIFNNAEVYEESDERKIRKRLREIAIKLDRLEAAKQI